MGVLTWKGATAKESLALGERRASCPSGRTSRASPTTRSPSQGATLFAESGCLNCHTYLGAGSSNLGAPDLSAEGAKGQTSWQVDHDSSPEAAQDGNSPMPRSSRVCGDENLTKIATFLEASKGEK